MDNKVLISELKDAVKQFCEDRNWNQFHDPKELSIGISTEANELLDIFRFKNKEQMVQQLSDPKTRKEISSELADVFYFILRFSQMNNIDLSDALARKIKINDKKYPIEKAWGNNSKSKEYID